MATNANINYVNGMSVDANGNLFFSDYSAHVIRKIMKSSNIISTVAGTGVTGYSGDNGYATNAQLKGPSDVVVDSIGFFLLLFNFIFKQFFFLQ
jgi:ABC-type xylose transport system substrate-binding protein